MINKHVQNKCADCKYYRICKYAEMKEANELEMENNDDLYSPIVMLLTCTKFESAEPKIYRNA